MKCQLTSRIRVGSFFLPSLTYLMWYIKLWWHEFRVRISKNVGCSRFQIHFSHFQTISRMWRWSKSYKASLQLRQFSHIKLASALGWTFGFGHWITIYLLATSFLVGILLAFYLTHCRQLRGIWLRALIFAFCELKRFICRQLSYFLLKVIKRYSSVRIKTFGRRLFYSFLYFFLLLLLCTLLSHSLIFLCAIYLFDCRSSLCFILFSSSPLVISTGKINDKKEYRTIACFFFVSFCFGAYETWIFMFCHLDFHKYTNKMRDRRRKQRKQKMNVERPSSTTKIDNKHAEFNGNIILDRSKFTAYSQASTRLILCTELRAFQYECTS